MASINIKTPIALQKVTNILVNAKDVENGSNCNCYCPSCKQDLIAVNKEIKQKAHFRHSPDANCPFKYNFESYVHWLAKEVFAEIEYINLPPIYYSHFALNPVINENLIMDLRIRLKKTGLIEEFSNIHLNFPDSILQKMEKIKIDGYATEQSLTTEYGDIRVDIVLNIGGNPLFIEPYFTNEIDDNKKIKIRNINISTISINLFEFIKKEGYYFDVETFKTFLIDSVYHKKWIYIREEKMRSLAKVVFNEKFEKNLKQIIETVTEKRSTNESIKQEIEKRNRLYLEINKVQSEIDRLSNSLKEVSIFDLFKG